TSCQSDSAARWAPKIVTMKDILTSHSEQVCQPSEETRYLAILNVRESRRSHTHPDHPLSRSHQVGYDFGENGTSQMQTQIPSGGDSWIGVLQRFSFLGSREIEFRP